MEVDKLGRENLVPHKGSNKTRGIIIGLDEPQNGMGYQEGILDDGRKWRSIRLGVKSSSDNIVYYELFGAEQEYAYITKRNEDKSYSTTKILFKERHKDFGEYRIIGRHLKKGNEEVFLVDYDAVKWIKDNFKDGDKVVVVGENVFSTYKDRPQVKYKINNMYESNTELDFDSEDFIEMADFEQEIVFVNAQRDEQKVIVTAYVILWNKDYEIAIFSVDGEKYPKLAETFLKLPKFGDQLRVVGKIHNRVEKIKMAVEDDAWGGKIPVGYTNLIKNRRKEMEITGVVPGTYEKKLYDESDFIKDEIVQNVQKISDLEEEEDVLPF